jgi:Ca2+-binding EF-hand superfamily protein
VTRRALENLLKYNSHSMFKAATLYYIGSQLIGKSEREELAKVFKSLDKTNRGSLSKDEIRLAFD